MGDFNVELSNSSVNSFCGSYSLKSLIKKPTYFKNPDNPTCIDLILINRQKSFQNCTIIETGLCDFRKLAVTIFKSFFKKLACHDFENFSKQEFQADLVKELSENNVDVSQFKLFQTIFLVK